MGKRATPHKLNLNTKEELELTGFTGDKRKLVLTVVLTLLTGGLLLILIAWRSSVKLKLTHRQCSLQEAQRVLVKDIYGQMWEEVVQNDSVASVDTKGSIIHHRSFTNKKIKYMWDESSCIFSRLVSFDVGTTLDSFQRKDRGLTGEEVTNIRALFGENFMKIQVNSVWQLLVQQAKNPFYIFQAYTVILWCVEAYYLFAGCIAALSILSVSLIVWETRRQSKALRETVSSEATTTVIRDGQNVMISSRCVVPNDVILLQDAEGRLEVDAILLEGSVVVNEAMLTGESVPITKVGVTCEGQVMFREEEHRKHILYSGTEILQVRGAPRLKAVVINTGFYTSRGELVRSILFPKPIDFHFYSDFMKLLCCFLVLGLAAMVWSIVKWIQYGGTWQEVLLNSLDLITFVVPPILPATITAINVWAQQRLKHRQIYCLSSNYISLAGSIDVVCFDKTGTLTEGDLAVAGVVPVKGGELLTPLEDLGTLGIGEPLTRALASCHSLTVVGGRTLGYPLDVKVFEATRWTMVEQTSRSMINQDYGTPVSTIVRPSVHVNDEGDEGAKLAEVAIVKIFPFQSREQRIMVVTKRNAVKHFEVYVKGAPEKVVSLCRPETIPKEWSLAMEWYTRQGLRVVAAAWRSLPAAQDWDKVNKVRREDLEIGLEFLGLVILQNRLMEATPGVIATLHRADIRTVMVTGDNILTALSVARQSGIVAEGAQLVVVKASMAASSSTAAQHLQVIFYDANHEGAFNQQRKMISVHSEHYVLATDGDSFELIRRQDQQLYRRLLHRGRVFARMKPEQKILVVEGLQDLGHQVAMCGDGCNDCGALKVAQTGISLSSSEASVAAPFTSQLADISCVPIVILEGRATLVSTFTCFKYNVAYCFAALIVVLFHYSIGTEPSDTQYVVLDLLLVTVPCLVMGNAGAPSRLVPRRPTRRILSFLPTISILSFLVIQTLTYWATWWYTQSQPWFTPYQFEAGKWPPNPSYENTTLILVSFYTFVIGAVVFSHAAPFRKPIYTNRVLSVYLLLATACCVFLTFYTGEWLVSLLNLMIIPSPQFASILMLGVLVNFFISFMWERWVLYGVIATMVLPWLEKTVGPRAPHQKVEKELKGSPEWPPLSPPPQFVQPAMVDNVPDIVPKVTESAAVDISDSDNEGDDGPDVFLMRQLTKRHRFNATVRRVSEDISISTPKAPPSSPFTRTPPQSAVYMEPFEGKEEKRDTGEKRDRGNIFKFNESVNQQMINGNRKKFKTFKGSPHYDTYAYPYEVVRLKSHGYDEDQDDLYETIQDIKYNHKNKESMVVPSYKLSSSFSELQYIDDVDQASTDIHPPLEPRAEVGSLMETQSGSEEKLYDVPRPPRPVLHFQASTDDLPSQRSGHDGHLVGTLNEDTHVIYLPHYEDHRTSPVPVQVRVLMEDPTLASHYTEC